MTDEQLMIAQAEIAALTQERDELRARVAAAEVARDEAVEALMAVLEQARDTIESECGYPPYCAHCHQKRDCARQRAFVVIAKYQPLDTRGETW